MRVICEAIARRLLVEFTYHDKHRVVAPYCHGTTRRGTEVVRAVQVRGDGALGFGKLWNLAEIRDARTTGERFTPDDPDYNPDDSAMRHIHCRVEARGERSESR